MNPVADERQRQQDTITALQEWVDSHPLPWLVIFAGYLVALFICLYPTDLPVVDSATFD